MSHASPLIEQDILAYLKQHESKALLRFITCGSVDDGKSTLIGRLLHDSQMIFEDQLAAITQDSKKVGTQGDQVDLALLVDGLQSERAQGITIDVAYRYFSTDQRKFIIADTPGHEQYTRNMATGASNCDLAVILVDASQGVQVQTKRHSFICSLLGIKNVIVAVNKMDKINYDQSRYKAIQADYLQLAGSLDIPNIHFVPISALKGDNVVNPSEHMSWFRGSTLMQYLETIDVGNMYDDRDFRLPVQLVSRPDSEFRGYQGTIASGYLQKGDAIRVLPSGQVTTVDSIVTYDQPDLEQAGPQQAITVTTEDALDISRGDMLVKKNQLAHVASRFRAYIVWMSQTPLEAYAHYDIAFLTKKTQGCVTQFLHQIDINTLQQAPCGQLDLNGIGLVDLECNEPVVFDEYQKNRTTGAFILIDRLSNVTVGAGMVDQPLLTSASESRQQDYSEFELELNALIRKHFPHWQAKDLRNAHQQ